MKTTIAMMAAVGLMGAWAEDGRVERRTRAARLARRALAEVSARGAAAARALARDRDLDLRVGVTADGATAWVDVLDARMRGDPLAALLAHRSTRLGATAGSFENRDASL